MDIGDNQSGNLWESVDSQIGIWESGIEMVLDSVVRLDSLAQTPDTCAVNCHPDNCEIWSPPGNSVIDTGPIGKFFVGQFKEIRSEGCDIKISNTDDGNILDISLRCDEKGTGEVQIFDLYGLLHQRKNDKKEVKKV